VLGEVKVGGLRSRAPLPHPHRSCQGAHSNPYLHTLLHGFYTMGVCASEDFGVSKEKKALDKELDKELHA
jgi:hypothetical protein